MNVPKGNLKAIINVLPGMRSPTVTPLASEDWLSVQSVVDEKAFGQSYLNSKNWERKALSYYQ